MVPASRAGDVRVDQGGEDLTLVAKPAKYELRIHATLNDFDRHCRRLRIVGADSLETRAHTAAANLLDHTIRPDSRAEYGFDCDLPGFEASAAAVSHGGRP